jgi:lysophospholipase L1-like esterase
MLKKTIFALAAILLVMALLETLARVMESSLSRQAWTGKPESGWQTKFFSTFLGWHENDPDLLWRFKANLDNPLIKTNSQHLLGQQAGRKKGQSVFRILLLGDSSPVGLGLKSRRYAFGEILATMLEMEYHGVRKVELINAAVSGYTSEQIARFLELKGWDYEPDLVILYCGNNDASISGPFSDRELMTGQKLRRIRNFFSQFALYRMMNHVLATQSKRDRVYQEIMKVRVSPERFAENLGRIAISCRKKKCPLVVIKPPVPYLWPAGLQFRLFRYTNDRDGQLIFPDQLKEILGRNLKYCIDKTVFRRLYGEGDIFTKNVYLSAYSDSMTPSEAIEYYSGLLDSLPDDPVVLNNLGVSCWQEGRYNQADHFLKCSRDQYVKIHGAAQDPAISASGSPFLFNIGINLLSGDEHRPEEPIDTGSAAFVYLDSALQADFLSLRIKRSYWEKIDRLGEEGNALVIDLPAIFRNHGSERLFIDHCHPTAEGHLLIAETLKDAIVRHGLVRF